MAEKITRIHGRVRFIHRRDTAEKWKTANPVLAAGEHGVVTDSATPHEREKIGDGVTPWNDLGWWHGPKGEQGEKGKDAVTDRTYNPQSENAQSGKAVAEAINGIPIAQAIPLPSALGSQLKPGLYFEKSGLSRVVGEINGEPLNEFFVKSSMADITQDSIFYIHVAKEGQTANSAVITIIGRGYYLDCDKPRNIAEYRVTNNSWEDITVDRNYVDTAIGSIETALDSIIAIQEQLIGGAV